MSDSKHPLYQKGFRRGREKTEAEIEKSRDQFEKALSHTADTWSQFFLAGAAIVAGSPSWNLDGKEVKDTNSYAEIAARFADRAMKQREKRFGRMG